jgi:glutamine cyclotransferase
MNHHLPDEYFGEGIAIFDDKVAQHTWKSQMGFIYKRNTFAELDNLLMQTMAGG